MEKKMETTIMDYVSHDLNSFKGCIGEYRCTYIYV